MTDEQFASMQRAWEYGRSGVDFTRQPVWIAHDPKMLALMRREAPPIAELAVPVSEFEFTIRYRTDNPDIRGVFGRPRGSSEAWFPIERLPSRR